MRATFYKRTLRENDDLIGIHDRRKSAFHRASALPFNPAWSMVRPVPNVQPGDRAHTHRWKSHCRGLYRLPAAA